MITIFFLMVLCHIIDDFVLQPICLSKLKQKKFWEKNLTKDFSMYKDDYKVALFIHALSWSIMISLPVMLFMHPNQFMLLIMVIINTIIHAYIDNLKANEYKINLLNDQLLHFAQIFFTFLIYLF